MERLICLLIGYICGLFQTSYIIGKIHKTDIREHGSGNAGTTNALRTFGKKAGAMTLLGDCLKCVIAVVAVRMIFRDSYGDILPLLSIYAATGCILGHNFPVYLNFRGGKGIAASAGFLIAFDWRLFVICAVLFFVLFFSAPMSVQNCRHSRRKHRNSRQVSRLTRIFPPCLLSFPMANDFSSSNTVMAVAQDSNLIPF